jgi:hypothetical protein
MTDLLPTIPAGRTRLLSATSISLGMSLLAILLSASLVGCSDSHSDEFVEFTDLEQTKASATSENQITPPVQELPEAPTPADTVEVVSHSTEADVSNEVVETSDPPQDAVATAPVVSVDADTEVPTGTPADAKPQPIKLLIPHRQFRQEGNALRASFDDIDLLKSLNMAPVPIDAADHFPDWLKSLNGEHVRIRGYMRPGFEAEDITEFLFVRDNGECCYGPIPKIYDMIAVELADGESTDLIEGTPFDVEGTFRIEPHADEVELYGLFFIDDGVIVE